MLDAALGAVRLGRCRGRPSLDRAVGRGLRVDQSDAEEVGTLIVGETFARALTAFDIDASGDLSNKRTWAKLPKGAVPDGICLDAADGIWSASPTTNECIRQLQGGEITHRIKLESGAFACMIGDDDLYVLTASSSDPKACRTNRDGRIEVYSAPYAAAGYA